MPDTDMGLAGSNTAYGKTRYLDFGKNKPTDSETAIRFTATKKYKIKSISITQVVSQYTFAYAIFKVTPAINSYGTETSDIIDLQVETDDPATQFDESKISYTRLMRPGQTSIPFDVSNCTLNIGESLYVRTTNNMPAGTSENANAKVDIVLTPI